MVKRTMVFVDANNFYHCVKKVISPNILDIQKIAKNLCGIKKFELVDIYWYASVPDIKENKEIYHRHNDFLLELEKRGIKVVRRKLQKVSGKEMNKKKNFVFSKVDFCERCRNLFSKSLGLFFSDKKEKGVDVWCAIDMIKYSCLKNKCDVCVLISGDAAPSLIYYQIWLGHANFVPALELIESEGKSVIVVSPHFGFSKELRDKFEYFVLKEKFLGRCKRGQQGRGEE